jgi:hypothetical protein
MQNVERYFYWLLTITLIVIIFGEKCKRDAKPCPPCDVVVSSKTDTVRRDVPVYKVMPVYLPGKNVYRVLERGGLAEDENKQYTADLLFDPGTDGQQQAAPAGYYFYNDTLRLKDSADKALGWVNVRDSFRADGELKRKFSYLLFNSVENTLAKPQTPQKNKPLFYVGVQAGGHLDNYLRFTSLSFKYVTPGRRNIFSAGAGLMDNKLLLSGEIAFKIGN